MQRWVYRGVLWGIVCLLELAVALAWAQTPAPSTKTKLERLRIAVAPLGWDTNFTWLQSRSGMLDKRPALEYLVGIDRNTGAYIPELAEKWEMSPDGKDWKITLRKGVQFHENWGPFTAKDVRHAVFLITQPESIQTDGGLWRGFMGITKNDSGAEAAKKVEQGVEIVDDHTVIFHLKQAAPEFVENISANADLVMESKARWDAGGKELYGQKVVGTGPFEFVERKVGSYVLYKRVENHWRKTPEVKELEFRWVPEGVTRLATLMAEEVHISDVDRALQRDAVAKGMKVIPSKLHSMQHHWSLGGLYFATPDKLDTKAPIYGQAGAAGHEHGDQSAGHCQCPPGWQCRTRTGVWLPSQAWTRRSGRRSGTLIGISVLRNCTAMIRSRRRLCSRMPAIHKALSLPCISTPCRGSQRLWISGRPSP